MIACLNGLLLEKTPPFIVLDCAGVGYELEVPMSTFYQLPETSAQLTGVDAHGGARRCPITLWVCHKARERYFSSIAQN